MPAIGSVPWANRQIEYWNGDGETPYIVRKEQFIHIQRIEALLAGASIQFVRNIVPRAFSSPGGYIIIKQLPIDASEMSSALKRAIAQEIAPIISSRKVRRGRRWTSLDMTLVDRVNEHLRQGLSKRKAIARLIQASGRTGLFSAYRGVQGEERLRKHYERANRHWDDIQASI
jgi:hypothetical protein